MRKQAFLSLTIVLSMLLGGVLVIAQAAPLDAQLLDMIGWTHQLQLSVNNNATTLLPAGYTAVYVLDTATLIGQNDMQLDCDDLRVTYGIDPAEIELDRLVEGCNTASTTVRFRTQADIPIDGNDHNYHLYYGNDLVGTAPANPRNVFAFYDDFQDGDAAGWNAAKGTWGVVNDGGNFIYRYTGGGAIWAISYPSISGVANLEVLGKMRAAASTTWIGLAFRIQDPNNFLTFYESRDGNLLKYARVISDDHGTPPATAASSMTANTWYNLRVQAVGSQVRARIWQTGAAEPTTWLIQYTDTAFQTQTNIGATLYNHITNADWDDIQVRKLVDVEPTVEIYEPPAPITGWYYRAPINMTNTSASATLPVEYTVQLTLDTANLITSGRMLTTCEDLRVGSVQGADVYEIDRVVENCNTANTRVWFALQRPILPGANDTGYYLFYGDPSPQPPLANGMNVFLFFEDWENGITHWTGAGGLDPANTGTMGLSGISNEYSISPVNSQRFPTKVGGGDAFSGYIPVAPSTSYAIGTWARSGVNTYVPVGINPYTAAYVVGGEVWMWTNEWTVGPTWAWRSAQFTTTSTTAFIKIKSEWWSEAPGDQPAYLDNLFLRYAIASEPTLALGEEETTLVLPVITNILDDGPVNLGSPVSITANISTSEGGIDSATLRIVSPVSVDLPMSLSSGTVIAGVWQRSYTPNQGGDFSYRILAHATTGRQATSALHTFSVTDNTPPQITQLTFTEQITVNDIQTVTVNVTDNGAVSSVSLTVGGIPHPMSQSGSQYSYAWEVTTIGEIPFTVTATDSANNQSQLADSFTSQAREVDVCTWKGCKPAAASWSNDDSNSNCTSDLVAAGFRGTFYVNGSTPQQWYTDYSAAGHEIGAHTVSHPCYGACCGSTCTPDNIWQCPYTQTEVNAYRTDQFDPNVAAIETSTGTPVLSGAWPCGCTDAGRMTAAMSYFLGVRGYNDCGCSWVQDNNASTPIMFMNLNGLHAYDQTYIDRAITDGTWTIVTSHGACDGISYMGSRSDVLWLPTVGEGLKYIKVRNAAQFSNYSRAGRTITFDAVHNLATFTRQQYSGTALLPIVFDNPVSLKVHILETDSVLSVVVGVDSVPYQIKIIDGIRYVVFDTPLNTTRHVVVNLGAPAPALSAISASNPVELGEQAQVNATVIPAEGTTLESVTLRVLSPEMQDYSMAVVSGNQYRAAFTPGQLGAYNYQVVALNSEGTSAQSTPASFTVVDTTAPASRNQSQSQNQISMGGLNVLTAEGSDLGGVVKAILSTDENGTWRDFDWPVSNWWNHKWAHRRTVTVAGTAGLARSNETVDLLVSSADFGGLSSCVGELRVTDENQVEIPSQVYDEQENAGVRTCHLLFQATVGADLSRIYYVYYGNPSATAPTYATDLTVTGTSLLTIQNAYFNLDLDTAANAGIITRMRLRQGNNTDLPLSTSANAYWGWHQVCSSADGNITGKNNLCGGGVAPASGLTAADTISGPLEREVTLTSVKTNATYTITYRFFANAPYYLYSLARTGTTVSVMNNFWYLNGNFPRLGVGTGGTPTAYYNTYDYTTDHLRITSMESVTFASIDGGDNDGTDLGALDYRFPSATGLNLYVTTGSDQTAAQGVLARLNAPLTVTPGPVENAPTGQYGSPIVLTPGSGWVMTSFNWQNPAI